MEDSTPPPLTNIPNDDEENEFDKIEMQDYNTDNSSSNYLALPPSTTATTSASMYTNEYSSWRNTNTIDDVESTSLTLKDENPRKRKRCAKGLGNLGMYLF